jgi:hypothetical protein
MKGNSINVSSRRDGVAMGEFVGEHDLTTKAETSQLLTQLATEKDMVVVDLCPSTFTDSLRASAADCPQTTGSRAGPRIQTPHL